tara:strand:+ start:426 stop:1358 length:933 start_codon:yes stop_codon:yes gene_type:complete
MYIKQVIENRDNWGYYLLGILVIIPITWVIFQIPFTIALTAAAFQNEELLAKMASNDISEMMSILEPNLNLFLMLLTYVGILVGVFISTKLLHKNSIRELTTSREKIDWSRFFFAFILWGTIMLFINLSDILIFSPADYEWNFKPIPFLILLSIALLMLPLQTSAEEYFFRGYLMQGLGIITGNRWVPLFFTSIAFGLVHYANPEVDQLGYAIFMIYIGSGFIYGITTLMDEGLELSLGMHAANNVLIALLVTSDWTALQTHSIYKMTSEPEAIGILETLPAFIFYFVVLYIFSKKYGWTNWQGKLFGKI